MVNPSDDDDIQTENTSTDFRIKDPSDTFDFFRELFGNVRIVNNEPTITQLAKDSQSEVLEEYLPGEFSTIKNP